MKCLCCNKELAKDEVLWHKSCIKHFFGSDTIPVISSQIDSDVETNISQGKSVTGVQPKLSYTKVNQIGNKKTTTFFQNDYIIKPNTKEFREIAEAEYVVMTLARMVKIRVADFGLIKDDKDNYVYIVKRFDRDNGHKIHVEDFCQLLELPTENKYQGSYEQCAKKVIMKYSNLIQFDLVEFYIRIIFSYLTLNSDMHLKNFSLIEANNITLSPQYDLLPVQLLVNDNEDLALTLHGKKKNLGRNDFITFGKNINILKPERIIDNLLGYENFFYKTIQESILSPDLKEKFIKKMIIRFKRLKANK